MSPVNNAESKHCTLATSFSPQIISSKTNASPPREISINELSKFHSECSTLRLEFSIFRFFRCGFLSRILRSNSLIFHKAITRFFQDAFPFPFSKITSVYLASILNSSPSNSLLSTAIRSLSTSVLDVVLFSFFTNSFRHFSKISSVSSLGCVEIKNAI